MSEEENTCDCETSETTWKDIISSKLVPVAAIAGAVTIIATGHDTGWGWLIFLAFLLTT